jgi:hypothetical protein
MEMIERYLQAVKFWLPKRQKNDIIAELSADIHAQVEEREAELGRKLTEAEIEAILKQRGRPIFVANRFLPQESLIGPLLFPVYRFCLKVAVLVYLIPWLWVSITILISAATFPAGQPRPQWFMTLATIAGHLWSMAFVAAGALTILFAILERVQAKSHFLDNWTPRKLPPVRNLNQIPRSGSSIELAVNLIFFAWWAVYAHSTEVFIGASVRISLNAQWLWFFWAYLLLALVNATLAAAKLMHPFWTTRHAALRLLSDAAGAGLFCWLMKANVLTAVTVAGVSPEKTATFAPAINSWTATFFPAALIVGLIIVGADIYRIVRIQSAAESLSA